MPLSGGTAGTASHGWIGARGQKGHNGSGDIFIAFATEITCPDRADQPIGPDAASSHDELFESARRGGWITTMHGGGDTAVRSYRLRALGQVAR
jgi:hypothetical protein